MYVKFNFPTKKKQQDEFEVTPDRILKLEINEYKTQLNVINTKGEKLFGGWSCVEITDTHIVIWNDIEQIAQVVIVNTKAYQNPVNKDGIEWHGNYYKLEKTRISIDLRMNGHLIITYYSSKFFVTSSILKETTEYSYE